MAEQIDFQTQFDEESESLRRTLEEMRREAEEEIMRLSSRLAERDYDPDSSVVTATERLALQQEMMVLQQTLEAKGQALDHITEAYKRFLEGRFRAHFKLTGTPLRIEMRSSKNPFVEDGRGGRDKVR